MPADAIGALTSAPAAIAPRNRFAEISSDEFVRILVTELTSQDPLDPTDSSAILEQLASLRTIESQMSLQDQLETLILQHQVGQAGAMIGRVVEGLDPNNDAVAGQVVAVRVVNGQAMLELDTGRELPMDRVTRIMQPVG